MYHISDIQRGITGNTSSACVATFATCTIHTASIIRSHLNTLRPWQNCRYFVDDVFKRIFLTENVWISLNISLEFLAKVRMNNIPALVHIMAWRRPGHKWLSEPVWLVLWCTCASLCFNELSYIHIPVSIYRGHHKITTMPPIKPPCCCIIIS